jgi:hypothetical protein
MYLRSLFRFGVVLFLYDGVGGVVFQLLAAHAVGLCGTLHGLHIYQKKCKDVYTLSPCGRYLHKLTCWDVLRQPAGRFERRR